MSSSALRCTLPGAPNSDKLSLNQKLIIHQPNQSYDEMLQVIILRVSLYVLISFEKVQLTMTSALH